MLLALATPTTAAAKTTAESNPAQPTTRPATTPTTSPATLSADKIAKVETALNVFKDDPLEFKPGTKFDYTTFGYTLLGAVIRADLLRCTRDPFRRRQHG